MFRAAANSKLDRMLRNTRNADPFSTIDTAFKPPVDVALQGYIDDITKYILPMATTKEQIVALAQ